jgi:hypothetical protein
LPPFFAFLAAFFATLASALAALFAAFAFTFSIFIRFFSSIFSSFFRLYPPSAWLLAIEPILAARAFCSCEESNSTNAGSLNVTCPLYLCFQYFWSLMELCIGTHTK